MEEIILDSNVDGNVPSPKWAGFWVRVLASLVDTLVYIPFIALMFYNYFVIKSLSVELLIILIFTVYKPFMEYKYGATLGKMAVKIKVVNTSFDKITLGQSSARYSPWLMGQILSVYGTINLFNNPEFLQVTSMIELSALQQSSGSTSISTISSIILLISCIVVAFTAKKQGLHDMLAKTYCVYKEKEA